MSGGFGARRGGSLAAWAALLLCAGVARAQAPDQDQDLDQDTVRGCPTVLQVAEAGVSWLASAPRDTSFSLDVDQRRWSRRDLSAATAVGAAGNTPAPWQVCAGARVEAREAELVMTNVRGQVRFRADAREFIEQLRLRRGAGQVPSNRRSP